MKRSTRILLATTAGLSAHQARAEFKKDFNFNYNVGVIHDDQGFRKVKGADDPSRTTSMVFKSGELVFHGEETISHVSTTVGLDLLAKDPADIFAYGWASKQFGKMVSLDVGKLKTHEGGFDNKTWDYRTVIVSPYTALAMPLPRFATGVQGNVMLGKAGLVSVQLVNDVVASEAFAYHAKESLQPAVTLEYMGSFGPVTPLLQFVSYDMNHSREISLGLGAQKAGLNLKLDYILDSRETRVGSKFETTQFRTMVADVSYAVGKTVLPFVKFADSDIKQPIKDLKGNTSVTAFDDNGRAMTVGAALLTFGESFIPAIGIVRRDSDVIKADDPNAAETKTSTTLFASVVGTL